MYSGPADISTAWGRAGSDAPAALQTLSRRLYPTTLAEVHAWAADLWQHNGLYRTSVAKSIRYFITELEVSGEDVDFATRLKYADMLNATSGVLEDLGLIGDDLFSLGTSATTRHIPFKRSLQCMADGCGLFTEYWTLWLAKGVQWVPDSKNPHFRIKCPKCGWEGEAKVHDTRLPADQAAVRIVRWPIQHLRTLYNPLTGDRRVYCDLSKYVELVRAAEQLQDPLVLSTTHMSYLEIMAKKELLMFKPEQMCFLPLDTLSVMSPQLQGWGLPPFMASFDKVVELYILRRFDEAIMSDYLVPFRVLSPPAATKEFDDPLRTIGGQGWKQQASAIIRAHRRNPTSIAISTSPMEYQIFGGEAANLMPVERITFSTQMFLRELGIPDEFTNGAASNAQPLINLNMFERFWRHLILPLNRAAAWLTDSLARTENWEAGVTAALVPVSVYESPDALQVKMQLAQAGEMPMTTFYRSLGLSYLPQKRAVMDEQRAVMKMQAEYSDDDNTSAANLQAIKSPPPGQAIMDAEAAQAQQAQGGMAPPAGGPVPDMGMAVPQAPMPGGGSPSLDQLLAEAQGMAEQLYTQPLGVRGSALADLKKTRPELHAQVKQMLENKDQEAGQQGVEMGRQGQMPPPA